MIKKRTTVLICLSQGFLFLLVDRIAGQENDRFSFGSYKDRNWTRFVFSENGSVQTNLMGVLVTNFSEAELDQEFAKVVRNEVESEESLRGLVAGLKHSKHTLPLSVFLNTTYPEQSFSPITEEFWLGTEENDRYPVDFMLDGKVRTIRLRCSTIGMIAFEYWTQALTLNELSLNESLQLDGKPIFSDSEVIRIEKFSSLSLDETQIAKLNLQASDKETLKLQLKKFKNSNDVLGLAVFLNSRFPRSSFSPISREFSIGSNSNRVPVDFAVGGEVRTVELSLSTFGRIMFDYWAGTLWLRLRSW